MTVPPSLGGFLIALVVLAVIVVTLSIDRRNGGDS